jgi:hypothetical protein
MQRNHFGRAEYHGSFGIILQGEERTPMSWVGDVFARLGVTGEDHDTCFPDGAAFRIEIPSVEGPGVLEAVLRAAEAEGITLTTPRGLALR